MPFGFALNDATGPRNATGPYFMGVSGADGEMPLTWEPGMVACSFFKYWATNDSIVGQGLIVTKGDILLWRETAVRNTFGDPLQDPTAFQIERPIPQVSPADPVIIRSGAQADAWLLLHPTDTTPPAIISITGSPDPLHIGDTFQMTFEVSEDLGAVPVVTFNGNSMALISQVIRTYTFSYVIAGSDPVGAVALLITLRDVSNNQITITNPLVRNINTVSELYTSPSPGVFPGSVSVSIITTHPGAIVRYTLDGSDPRTYLSPVYSTPVVLTYSTVIKAVFVDGNVVSDVSDFSFTIGTSGNGTSNTPAIYPLFERDIVVRGEVAEVDGALIRVRVNTDEYQGLVKNGKYSIVVLALQLGDVVAVACESTIAGKLISHWATIRPQPRYDNYTSPQSTYWGGTGAAASPIETYRGDSITIEIPLLYKGVPLILPSGRLMFYVSSSSADKSKMFESEMYQLQSGSWAVDLNGEFQISGTYWCEISIEKPDMGQVTLQAMPFIVKEDLRP